MSNFKHVMNQAVVSLAMVLVAALLGAAAMGGCEREGAAERKAGGTGSKVTVVATIGMIADVAREVCGDRARVVGLMGEGVDPHTYKASPSDVRALTDADVVLYNGLHLEGRMGDVFVKLAAKKRVVQVTDAIEVSSLREPAEFEGQYDPHVWFDVSMWSKVVGRIAGAMGEADESGKGVYRERAAAYERVLGELHEYCGRALASVAKERRVLVTAHDAFGYFGRAYDVEVMAIQGISTDSEASLKGINALVDTLVKRKVPAVFVESSVPRKTIDALVEGCAARGHTVKVGGELFSDAMGAEGTFEGTYVGMVMHNVRTIVQALGGTMPETMGDSLRAQVAKHEGVKGTR